MRAVIALCCAGILAACATPVQDASAPQPAALPETREHYSAPKGGLAAVPPSGARSVDEYKQAFAERIAQASAEHFLDPLPRMLKSVVVLEITIDRDGRVSHVGVRRSNGYKALENRAIASVRNAAPFAAPPRSVRSADGSLHFLETFLFRDDDRFQIRSLAVAQ